jgi:hypothetical protein
MMTYQLQRTGARPLSFEGRLVARADSRDHGGRSHNRWHEVSVYQTSGRWVCSVNYCTQWRGEPAYADVATFPSLCDLATWLENYVMPNTDRIGYPAKPEYAERQRNLLAALDAGLRDCVSRVLTECGIPATLA